MALRRQGPSTPPEEKWTKADIVNLVGVILTFVASMWAAYTSVEAKKAVRASHIEIASVSTNSNGVDFEHPWGMWKYVITERTITVGVQRLVTLKNSFQNIPAVNAFIQSVNVEPLDAMLSSRGYCPADSSGRARLKYWSYGVSVESHGRDAFWLRVGVTLPAEAAQFLVNYLQSTELSQQSVDAHRLYAKLESHGGQLTSDEKFMMNFYLHVGTIDVGWIATEAIN